MNRIDKGITDCIGQTPVVRLELPAYSDFNVYAKLEGYNPTGSVKDRAADYVLSTLLSKKLVNSKTKIIESSSGNFAISLAVFCKKYGLDFTCVIDPNISSENERILENLDVNIVKVEERDKNGGYLLSRIEYVKSFLNNIHNSYWVNQYANPLIVDAYCNTLGNEIRNDFNSIDYIFAGVSSGGTIAGVSRSIKKYMPNVKVIAVDVEGSVVFGGSARKRLIPGIGSSMKPDNLKYAQIDDVITITEIDTVRECHELLKQSSLLVGGSSGSVISGIKKYIDCRNVERQSNILAIFPDRGDRYCSTIYNEKWCHLNYVGF